MELVKHRAKGIDISSNNHGSGEPFDYKKVKEAGYEFVYVKATQGNYYLNEYLLGDTKRAYEAGLRVGIYHFLEGDASPEEQADWFFTNGIAQVIRENGDILGLFPMLDYETGTPDGAIRDAFINRMHEHYTHVCGQYMDRSFYDVLGHAGSFTWLAWPGWTPHDDTPSDVHCVQYGQEEVPGILAMTDVNLSLDYHMMQIQFDAPKPNGDEDTSNAKEPTTPRSNDVATAAPIVPIILPTVTATAAPVVADETPTDRRVGERRSGNERRTQA